MAHFTRREFLKTGLAAGTLAVSGGLPLIAQPVDCVTLGYESPAEIDEAIENLNLALAS